MNRNLLTILMTAVVSLSLVFFVGCESDAGTGAIIGGGAGAGIGALAGGDTEGALIGAAVGTAAGYMIGNQGDKKKAAAERDGIRNEMNVVTVNVVNDNGSITPVRLRKSGVVYIGPRGETYTTLPTPAQLKAGGYGL